jgi:hypothetical protein
VVRLGKPSDNNIPSQVALREAFPVLTGSNIPDQVIPFRSALRCVLHHTHSLQTRMQCRDLATNNPTRHISP